MILSFKANCAAVAASVLLLPAISASSAFAQMPSLLPPSTPEIPGVLLSQSNQVFGTVLERRDVPFSIASNAYDYQGSAGTPYNVCFRNSDVTVPGYLLPRYAAAGAAVGTCTNPVPFNLTGILSSLVVDRDPSPVVVLLDFYYQLINTSVSPPGSGADIFRLTVTPTNPGGFLPTDMLSVFYTKNLVGLGLNEGGPSLKAPYTADRDVTLGSVGFNFDFSHLPSFLNTNLGGLSDAPGNIDSGEASAFIVIRTNLAVYSAMNADSAEVVSDQMADVVPFEVVISGAGTAVVTVYGPVPEPTAAVLASFGMLAAAAIRPRRRR